MMAALVAMIGATTCFVISDSNESDADSVTLSALTLWNASTTTYSYASGTVITIESYDEDPNEPAYIVVGSNQFTLTATTVKTINEVDTESQVVDSKDITFEVQSSTPVDPEPTPAAVYAWSGTAATESDDWYELSITFTGGLLRFSASVDAQDGQIAIFMIDTEIVGGKILADGENLVTKVIDSGFEAGDHVAIAAIYDTEENQIYSTYSACILTIEGEQPGPVNPAGTTYTWTGTQSDDEEDWYATSISFMGGKLGFHITMTAGAGDAVLYVVDNEIVGGKNLSAGEFDADFYVVSGFEAGDHVADLIIYQASSQQIIITEADCSLAITTTYLITYNANGGIADRITDFVESGRAVVLPSATYEGKYFVGWFNDNKRIGGAGERYTPVSDMTVTARWTEDQYVVQFVAEGISPAIPAVTIPAGAPVVLPSADKDGYTLKGWYDGETKVGGAGERYTPTGTISLNAVWQPIEDPESETSGDKTTILGLDVPVFGAVAAVLVGIVLAAVFIGRRYA